MRACSLLCSQPGCSKKRTVTRSGPSTPMQRTLLTLSEQERFAKRHGVSAEDFRKAYRSFGVETHLTRIRDLMRRYWVLAVPTFVVNGKYVVRGTVDSSYSDLLEIVDKLVQRELTEQEQQQS